VITGTIHHIENHGTIISLVVRGDDQRQHYVHFDHSSFRWMAEARYPRPIVGAHVTCEGELGEQTVRFEDGEVTDVAA